MKSRSLPTPQIEKLFEQAYQARNHAYCPYSHHAVGCAIQIENKHKLYSGCNVENASFGATVCAERVALQNAITHEGQVHIQTILILTDADPPWAPCGLCRQVLSEFTTLESIVYLANLEKKWIEIPWNVLFPHSFSTQQLLTPSQTFREF